MTKLTACLTWWWSSRSRWLQVWWLDCRRLNHNWLSACRVLSSLIHHNN